VPLLLFTMMRTFDSCTVDFGLLNSILFNHCQPQFLLLVTLLMTALFRLLLPSLLQNLQPNIPHTALLMETLHKRLQFDTPVRARISCEGGRHDSCGGFNCTKHA